MDNGGSAGVGVIDAIKATVLVDGDDDGDGCDAGGSRDQVRATQPIKSAATTAFCGLCTSNFRISKIKSIAEGMQPQKPDVHRHWSIGNQSVVHGTTGTFCFRMVPQDRNNTNWNAVVKTSI